METFPGRETDRPHRGGHYVFRFPHRATVSAVTRVALFVVALAIVPVGAGAQRSASIVAGVRTQSISISTSSAGSSLVKSRDSGHAVGMANGALIGAGIGIAVGLVASPIVNSQNRDHTEDSMTYIVLPAFGAFLGLIIGGIVGWRRGS